MERFLVALVPLALLLSVTTSVPTSASGFTAVHLTTAASTVAAHAQAEQTDPAKITVYVTRTGAKYHRENCRYLSKSKIPMSLKDAAKKYEPCKVCKAPTLPK